MTAQIAKYRAEAADLRDRAALAAAQGCMNDAAAYIATAEGREALADALEADMEAIEDDYMAADEAADLAYHKRW